MAKLSIGQLLKGPERIEVIKRLNESNSDRELVKYIDEKTFHYIYDAYELYCDLINNDCLPLLKIDMWRHTPENNLLYEILIGANTSYTHRILFYAQTEYLLNFINEKFNIDIAYEINKLLNNIFNSSLFPFTKLILVGVFPFLGYSLLTGISQVLRFNWSAFTDK